MPLKCLLTGTCAAPRRAGSRPLHDRAAALHASELHLTAQQLRTQVESHLDAITAILPRAGEHIRALTIAAGETAALAGWVAWDLGDHQAARSYYQVTLDCAKEAGHPPLRALALAYASYGASNPTRALELLGQATDDHVLTPTMHEVVGGNRAPWELRRSPVTGLGEDGGVGYSSGLRGRQFARPCCTATAAQQWQVFVFVMVEDFAGFAVKKPTDHESSVFGRRTQLHQDGGQPLPSSAEAEERVGGISTDGACRLLLHGQPHECLYFLSIRSA